LPAAPIHHVPAAVWECRIADRAGPRARGGRRGRALRRGRGESGRDRPIGLRGDVCSRAFFCVEFAGVFKIGLADGGRDEARVASRAASRSPPHFEDERGTCSSGGLVPPSVTPCRAGRADGSTFGRSMSQRTLGHRRPISRAPPRAGRNLEASRVAPARAPGAPATVALQAPHTRCVSQTLRTLHASAASSASPG
jgi:hypothetical protein